MRVSAQAGFIDHSTGDVLTNRLSWCIPGGVEHGADSLEDSVAVEVFSPVRDDYVPKPM